VLNLSPVYAATNSDVDTMHARLEDGRLVRWYMDALFSGRYPADVLEYLGADAPRTQTGDAALISETCDFLGINYYYPIMSAAKIRRRRRRAARRRSLTWGGKLRRRVSRTC
jgi:beta-glucosidase